MTITIYEGFDKSYITLGSKDERFVRAWGKSWTVPTSNIFKKLEAIASWVNESLGEECLFELD